jgi:protein TonB
MHALRIPVAGLGGALFAASMFWVLWSFVETTFVAGERLEPTRVEFARIRPDTEVIDTRRERIERDTPPRMPEAPGIAVPGSGVENHIAEWVPPIGTRGARTRIAMTAGSDRDVIPLVRIDPDYPPAAIRRELEGWVQVQFTITPAGSVKDAIVVDAEPKDVFDDAALKAIVRWRYNPKVESGAAVERVGVQTRIVFRLD